MYTIITALNTWN